MTAKPALPRRSGGQAEAAPPPRSGATRRPRALRHGWAGPSAAVLLSAAGILLALAACRPVPQPPAEPSRLTVFAAASLTDVFEALGEVYQEQHPGTDVILNFGASSALRTQLAEGAQADVAAFAAEKDLALLAEAGLVDPEAVAIFAANEIVVVVHPDSAAELASLADLTRPGVKLILAADGVPAGDYARQVIANLDASLGQGFAEGVFANVVSEEDNVRQVLAKVQLGEVDAGWVYRSDAHAAPELRVLDIPAGAGVSARYPIVVLNQAPNPEGAHAFLQLVLSESGQRVIEQGGFVPGIP